MKKAREIIHKINSPLTSVIGYSELVSKRDIDEKSKDWVLKIHQEALRMKDLMKELSDAIPESPDGMD